MSNSGPGRREVAYRLFAAEFDDAEFSYSESDEERAPNFVVTPTGARVNRLFAVGVLTEVEDVNPEMVRGRVVDPTGAFVTYAGQYQPDELAFLERVEPPAFLALSGKARTFEPDDGDRVYTSVRPESVSEVDAETRDRWVVTAAERTLDRIGVMASAIASGLEGDPLREALEAEGVDERLADGVALALEYYETSPTYLEALRETALDAVRVVAGETEEVERLDIAPAEGGGDASALATLELSAPETGVATEPSASEPEPDAAGAGAESPTTSDPDFETASDGDAGTTAGAGAEPDAATADHETEPGSGAVSGTDPAPTDAEEPEVETAAGTEAGAGAMGSESATGGTAEPDPVAGESEDSAEADAGEGEPELEADAADEEPTAEDVEAVEEELEDLDPGEFELDEEERREIEEQYGTEFSTADEVEDAGIEAPEPADGGSEGSAQTDAGEGESELEADADGERESEDESGPTSEAAPDADEAGPELEADPKVGDEPGGDDEPGVDAEASAEEVVLEDAVMETMEELDEGDGADREELVATVADEYGALPEDVEDAIQDALMSGRCYEPSDGVLKSI